MKKTLLVFSCICSLFLVSCASKNIPQEEDSLQAPETNVEADSTEEGESPENTEGSEQEGEDASDQEEENKSEYNDEDEDEDEDADEVELIEESFVLPEPEAFDEPVVITLLPEEEAPEEAAEAPEEKEEEPLPEEKIEVEVIPEVTEASDTNPDEVESDKASEAETEEESSADQSENDAENNIEDNSEEDDVIEVLEEDSDYSDDGVISVGDGDEGAVIEDEEESIETEEITPSRKVTLKKMEYLDIVYPGRGWIYMGITDGSKDLSYFGRKLGTENTKFTLQARNAGVKIIHFYKNDALTGQYLDDYIEVEILNQKGSNKTHITAPEYKQPLPKKAKEKLNKPEIKADEESESVEESQDGTVKGESSSESSATKTKGSDSKSTSTIQNSKAKEDLSDTTQVIKNSEENSKSEEDKEIVDDLSSSSSVKEEKTESPIVDSNILLQEAQVLYNEKEYKLALEKINSFLENASSKRDQGLYLQGQILEAKSQVQDIKAAIEAYTTLTKNYPASKCWDDANKRIIYLKRFYLEVR